MNTPYKTEAFITPAGNQFRVDYLFENCSELPWEHCDGHGQVSNWTRRDKKPGEIILHTDHSSKRFYDMQGAIKTAKAEGWSCDAVLPTDTPSQKAVKAAQADFDNLRAWCNSDWWYCCLHVIMVDSDGDEMEGYDDYLGMVDDGYDQKLKDWNAQNALTMAEGIEQRYQTDQGAELVAELHHVHNHALYLTGII
jgi:hypothetical protein